MKKTLICTVGLPRSGKSTWAEKQNIPIVSGDSIRLALHGVDYLEEAEPMVWTIAKIMIKALFHSNHEKVILDNTSISSSRRDEWMHFADKNGYVIEWKYILTKPDICVIRALDNDQPHMVKVIIRMLKESDLFGSDKDKENMIKRCEEIYSIYRDVKKPKLTIVK